MTAKITYLALGFLVTAALLTATSVLSPPDVQLSLRDVHLSKTGRLTGATPSNGFLMERFAG
jgi:hypothetical protein